MCWHRVLCGCVCSLLPVSPSTQAGSGLRRACQSPCFRLHTYDNARACAISSPFNRCVCRYCACIRIRIPCIPPHSHCLPYTHPAAITLGADRFKAPEALFNPLMLGKDSPGLHQMVHDAIHACDAAKKREMYGNVVLAGGTSLFEGWVQSCKRVIIRAASAAYHAFDGCEPCNSVCVLAWLACCSDSVLCRWNA